ncbi:hypothetical protein HB13667_16665 [Pseudomonas putida]|uniref:Uncharacterized protein n=1 Tax=Pseudomonas putida TaxID=303 RepID=A0A0P7D313_PSEPU|nr:hypothetical protein [Pseudomonas putida]KPM62817.1 hypothetical protein HB13667_16665 [Pseudomonas putida]
MVTEDNTTWLRQNEWEWAEAYLRKRAPRDIFLGRFDKPGYARTTQIIEDIEQTTEGIKLIERLKNALRQRRYRSPSNGRKACTFSLPTKTVTRLRHLANKHDQPETSIVAALIDGLYDMTKTQQAREEQLKKTAQIERQIANQAKSLLKAQLEEAMKHLERQVELVVMWELSLEAAEPPFEGDETQARLEVDKRMKGVQRELRIIATKHALTSERLI